MQLPPLNSLSLREECKCPVVPTGVNQTDEATRNFNVCWWCHGPMMATPRFEYADTPIDPLKGTYMDPRVQGYVDAALAGEPDQLRQWSWDTAILADGHRYHRRCLVAYYKDEQRQIDADKTKREQNRRDRREAIASGSTSIPHVWIPERPYNQFARCPNSTIVNEDDPGMHAARGQRPTEIYDPPPSTKDVADIVNDMNDPLIGQGEVFDEDDATEAEKERYNYAIRRMRRYKDPHPPPQLAPEPPEEPLPDLSKADEELAQHKLEMMAAEDARKAALMQLEKARNDWESDEEGYRQLVATHLRQLEEAKSELQRATKEAETRREKTAELQAMEPVSLAEADQAKASLKAAQARLEEMVRSVAAATESSDAQIAAYEEQHDAQTKQIEGLKRKVKEFAQKAAINLAAREAELKKLQTEEEKMQKEAEEAQKEVEQLQKELAIYTEQLQMYKGAQSILEEEKAKAAQKAKDAATAKAEAEKRAAERRQDEKKAQAAWNHVGDLWKLARDQWKRVSISNADPGHSPKHTESEVEKAARLWGEAHDAQKEANEKWGHVGGSAADAKSMEAALFHQEASDARTKAHEDLAKGDLAPEMPVEPQEGEDAPPPGGAAAAVEAYDKAAAAYKKVTVYFNSASYMRASWVDPNARFDIKVRTKYNKLLATAKRLTQVAGTLATAAEETWNKWIPRLGTDVQKAWERVEAALDAFTIARDRAAAQAVPKMADIMEQAWGSASAKPRDPIESLDAKKPPPKAPSPPPTTLPLTEAELITRVQQKGDLFLHDYFAPEDDDVRAHGIHEDIRLMIEMLQIRDPSIGPLELLQRAEHRVRTYDAASIYGLNQRLGTVRHQMMNGLFKTDPEGVWKKEREDAEAVLQYVRKQLGYLENPSSAPRAMLDKLRTENASRKDKRLPRPSVQDLCLANALQGLIEVGINNFVARLENECHNRPPADTAKDFLELAMRYGELLTRLVGAANQMARPEEWKPRGASADSDLTFKHVDELRETPLASLPYLDAPPLAHIAFLWQTPHLMSKIVEVEQGGSGRNVWNDSEVYVYNLDSQRAAIKHRVGAWPEYALLASDASITFKLLACKLISEYLYGMATVWATTEQGKVEKRSAGIPISTVEAFDFDLLTELPHIFMHSHAGYFGGDRFKIFDYVYTWAIFPYTFKDWLKRTGEMATSLINRVTWDEMGKSRAVEFEGITQMHAAAIQGWRLDSEGKWEEWTTFWGVMRKLRDDIPKRLQSQSPKGLLVPVVGAGILPRDYLDSDAARSLATEGVVAPQAFALMKGMRNYMLHATQRYRKRMLMRLADYFAKYQNLDKAEMQVFIDTMLTDNERTLYLDKFEGLNPYEYDNLQAQAAADALLQEEMEPKPKGGKTKKKGKK